MHHANPDRAAAALTLPVPLIATLCDTLSHATAPMASFDAIGVATRALLGPGLLTINAYRHATSQVVRLWSSDIDAYPVGGSKYKGDTPWTRQVLRRGEVFVGEGDAALAAVFDDIATIRGLGLSAVVNVPVCDEGRCIGTFNFLAARAAWTDSEVVTLRWLAQMVAPAILCANRC